MSSAAVLNGVVTVKFRDVGQSIIYRLYANNISIIQRQS